MESLPSWKRDLIRKKQTQINSLVFMSRQSSNVTERGTVSRPNGNILRQASSPEAETSSILQSVTSTENGDEHILPVTENPWLRRDPVSRKRLSDHRTSEHRSPSSEKRSELSTNRWSAGIDASVVTNDDDVFNEEVTYGKGFVHKILLKFSHIAESEKQEERGRKWSRAAAKKKRSQSAENILESSHKKSTLHSASMEFSSPRESSASDGLSPRDNNSSFASPRSLNDLPSPRDNAGVATRSEESSKREESGEVELPKKNIVASTRDVFERITSPTPIANKQAFLYPKESVTSPRNSVHSLIAVDTTSTTTDELKVECDESSKATVVSNTSSDKNIKRDIISGQSLISANNRPPVVFASRKPSSDDTGVASTSSSSVTSQQTSDLKPSPAANTNGTATGSNASVSTVFPAVKDPAALKKRKAPLPPKPAPRSPKPTSPPVVAASKNSSVSVAPASNIGSLKSKSKAESFVYDVSQTSSSSTSASASKAASSQDIVAPTAPLKRPTPRKSPTSSTTTTTNEISQTPKSEASFKAGVEALKSEVVKSSKPRAGGSNDAQSVIGGSSRKAKIVTPKSAGPGSLLIRPASNMVQSKSAQRNAQIEMKYDDIRTGEFAPPNKKPAYYDEDNDSDLDFTDSEVTSQADGEKRKSKGGKYEFVGAGVVPKKSSLSKKKRENKVGSIGDVTVTCKRLKFIGVRNVFVCSACSCILITPTSLSKLDSLSVYVDSECLSTNFKGRIHFGEIYFEDKLAKSLK